MSDAPERIWVATWREGDWREGDWDDNEGKALNEKPCIQYVRADRIEALTEQLAAARQDAKAAEDELEMQEQEGCMMENDYIKLEKERDALEAKLAKAVEALEPFARAAETWEPDDGDSGLGARIEHPHHGLERHAEFTFGDLRRARATLAEIKGESHE